MLKTTVNSASYPLWNEK